MSHDDMYFFGYRFPAPQLLVYYLAKGKIPYETESV